MNTSNDLARDTQAVILAGGKGTRLGALTRNVCKLALPFGAAYRTIDFSLSNCINSGIRRVGVPPQHQQVSLIRHINGVCQDRVTTPGDFIVPSPALRLDDPQWPMTAAGATPGRIDARKSPPPSPNEPSISMTGSGTFKSVPAQSERFPDPA